MKHYLKVAVALFNFSTKRFLEHRWNTVGSLISSVASLVIVIIFIKILFSYSPNIQGWSRNEVFFLTGLYRIFAALFSFLFLRSINYIPYYIHRGELDAFLLKPINSQFHLSLRHLRSYEILNILPGLILAWYAVGAEGIEVSLLNWIILGIGFLLGLAIFYGIYFSIATLAVWMVRFESLGNLYYVISQPLNFPTDLFGKGLSFILTFVIPLGLVISVPTKLFFGKSPATFLLIEAVFALLMLSFSIWFWKFALRHYASASS